MDTWNGVLVVVGIGQVRNRPRPALDIAQLVVAVGVGVVGRARPRQVGRRRPVQCVVADVTLSLGKKVCHCNDVKLATMRSKTIKELSNAVASFCNSIIIMSPLRAI